MCSSSSRTCPEGRPGRARRIENYLGFPTGISGLELTGRAYAQAQKFGAQVMVAKGAAKLACAPPLYAVHLEDGGRIDARALIIASGRAVPQARRSQNLSQFEGAGVYYAASRMESQLCGGEEVVVVGGGNSAGQAAVFLAETAKHVHILVRKDGLADTMSRYLFGGSKSIRRSRCGRKRSSSRSTERASRSRPVARQSCERRRDSRHQTCVHDDGRGAQHGLARWLRRTRWGRIHQDWSGLVGRRPESAEWPLARTPYLLETNRPGIFAVGDVRGGNIKRVASAVGEGSIAVAFVHQVLHH